MPIRKTKGRYRFEFDRIINGQRVRASKLLPKGWDRKQADAYETKETAHLFSLALGQAKQEYLIQQAVAIYIKERCPTLKSGKAVHLQLELILPLYEGKYISQLPQVAAEIRNLQISEYTGLPLSERTKQSHIAILRAACRYAWKHHGMGDHDPAERVVMPKVDNARHNYASRKEMLTIAKHCRRSSRPYIRIAFYSGMRLGEILKAEVAGEHFSLGKTKNGDPRLIPVHPKIASALKFIPPKVAKTTIQDHFREARQKAKLEKYTFHDLRHSAASEMINNNVDLYVVGAVLGHKDPRSTKRYAHLNINSLQAAVRKIGSK